MKSLHTDFLIMDEVQRLKNWNTQIARSARHIESEYAVILSGTPLENKLEDLHSIVQLVDQYRLGPYYQFIDDTILKLDTGKVMGYTSLNSVGDRLKEVLIRRRKKDVALKLLARMNKVLFVPMTEEQRNMHEEFQSEVAKLVAKWTRNRFLSEKDRERLLLRLSMIRMVCDSTYILDRKTRCDIKMEETINILRNVFESGDEKVVIFSQWERMTHLIADELDKLNIGYRYLHGGIPSKERKDLVDNFTGQPGKRVFILTDTDEMNAEMCAGSDMDRNDNEEQREQSKEEEKKTDDHDEIIPNATTAAEVLIDDSPATAAIHEQPEATQKLVDSIAEKDEATGQTSLRIPVADKETVVNALNLIGKLLTGK